MKFSQSKPLYDALLKVQKGWEKEESKEDGGDDFAAAQRRRAVENSLRSMKLGGVGFEEGSPEQARYKEIKMRQAELSTDNRDAVNPAAMPGARPRRRRRR